MYYAKWGFLSANLIFPIDELRFSNFTYANDKQYSDFFESLLSLHLNQQFNPKMLVFPYIYPTFVIKTAHAFSLHKYPEKEAIAIHSQPINDQRTTQNIRRKTLESR